MKLAQQLLCICRDDVRSCFKQRTDMHPGSLISLLRLLHQSGMGKLM